MTEMISDSENWEVLAQELGYSAKRLAEYVGISLRQLERKFKKYYRTTVREWILRCRMKTAIHYLARNEKIAYIAHQLGYKQPAHFCCEFKKYFGTSPSKYRVCQQ